MSSILVSTVFLLYIFLPSSFIGSFASANIMSINVYSVDDDKKVSSPLRVSSTYVSGRHVDLLLFECNGIQQYTTMNFSRLPDSQISNHEHVVFCCKQCRHAQRTKFPKDPRCRFINIQLPAPFVVYADVESILKPVGGDVIQH